MPACQERVGAYEVEVLTDTDCSSVFAQMKYVSEHQLTSETRRVFVLPEGGRSRLMVTQ